MNTFQSNLVSFTFVSFLVMTISVTLACWHYIRTSLCEEEADAVPVFAEGGPHARVR